MNVVYCSRGMQHFGQIASEALGWPLFVDTFTGDVDVAYIIGLYDPPTYDRTLRMTKRAKKRVIHWCGSDVLMLHHPDMLPEATHLCESQSLADELAEKGIEAHVCPFPVRSFPVNPFPDSKSVGVYLGNNGVFYGSETVVALADAMPDVDFVCYPYGTVQPEYMGQVIDKCRAYLRLTPHDGSCTSACEYMSAGRRAVVTADVPYAKRVRLDDFPGIVRAVRWAVEQTEPDYDAAAYWVAQNDVSRYLSDVGEFLADA